MGMLEDAIRQYARFADRADAPGTPATDQALLYVESGELKLKRENGTVTTFGSGGGGGGGGRVELDRHTVTTSVAAITFDEIPAGYHHLLVETYLRSDAGGNVDTLTIRVGDTTVASAAGSYAYSFSNAGTAAGAGASNSASATSVPYLECVAGAGQPAGRLYGTQTSFYQYDTSLPLKPFVLQDAQTWSGTSGNYLRRAGSGIWVSGGSPLNIITLTPGASNFTDGYAVLYGVPLA